jgi:hypothetical protein
MGRQTTPGTRQTADAWPISRARPWTVVGVVACGHMATGAFIDRTAVSVKGLFEDNQW